MPRLFSRMTVLVASPSDTIDERAALERIIAATNRTAGAENGVFLELVKWETHVRPSISSDGQAVINSQLPVPDAVLGIFWRRIGTQTPRARSGSIEEIEGAIERWRRKDDVDVLVYFNQAASGSSNDDNVVSGELVGFKRSLQESGVLTWDYEGTADFERQVKEHLDSLVRMWATRHSIGADVRAQPSSLRAGSLITVEAHAVSRLRDDLHGLYIAATSKDFRSDNYTRALAFAIDHIQFGILELLTAVGEMDEDEAARMSVEWEKWVQMVDDEVPHHPSQK